jgi:signal transduction histidine kinase
VTSKIHKNKDIDLIATTVHELKTPLVLVRGLAEMFADEQFGKVSDEQAKNLERMNLATQRMLKIVESLITLSRSQTNQLEVELEPVDVNSAISQVLEELKPFFSLRKIKLKWRPGKVPPLMGEPNHLYSIIYNLTDNAIKYSPEGSELSIKCHRRGDMVVLMISDQGVGMKPGELKKLWQRFSNGGQPLTSQLGSSGLGLFIVKNLVEILGGRIEVKALSQGTCFSVSLPSAQQMSLLDPRLFASGFAEKAGK